MKINPLTSFATSSIGQRAYKWLTDPKKERFLNNTLPQLETILSTSCYIWSTSRRKEIDEERRKLLQIQNIGSGLVGLTVAGYANKKVYNYGENVIKHLDKKIDPKSIRQISAGLRVGLPILTTALVMRFIIPSFIALFSGKMMDRERERKLNAKC